MALVGVVSTIYATPWRPARIAAGQIVIGSTSSPPSPDRGGGLTQRRMSPPPGLLIAAREGGAESRSRPGSRITYEGLLDSAVRFGSGLRRAGVAPGDHVAVAMANEAPAVVATLGVLFAGGAFVLVHPEATRGTFDAVLRTSQATALVTESGMAAKASHAASRVSTLRSVISRGPLGQSVLTTGQPHAMAWINVPGSPSKRDESAKTRARAM
jgi:acyl-coenzyme A synthetase/AMP-(fatty) acid ligase